jgi:hypothetical protein
MTLKPCYYYTPTAPDNGADGAAAASYRTKPSMSCMVKPRNKAEGGRKVKRKNCV